MFALKSLPKAPASLGPAVEFGRYLGEIANTDTSHWDGAGMFSRRRTQRKTWLYFGAFSERYMMGFAVVDAGLLATAFVYVYDRQRKLLVEEKASRPFGFPAGHQPGMRGEWAFSSGGRSWRITPEGKGWRLAFEGKRLRVNATVSDAPGMCTLAPSVRRPFHYTYKACTLPVALNVAIDGQEGSTECSGMVDYTLGYPPRHTTWNWASGGGTTGDGRRWGLNIVAHFINGLENSVWLGDEIIPLAQTVFDYDPQNTLSPWRLRTVDGVVDLRFTPEGERAERISAGVMVSDFSQPFGRYEGVFRLPSGEIPVTGYGVVEEHIAVW